MSQLNGWASRFQSESDAIAFLTVKTGIGFYSLRRVFQGKKNPDQPEQKAICEATGLELDALFPVSEAKKESA